MGVHTKTTSPEINGALAHSERPFYLPTWAQLLTAAPRTYSRDVQIFGQQEPAEYLSKLSAARCGHLACCAMVADT